MQQHFTLNFRNIVRYGLMLLAVTALVGYSLWQARLLIIGPVIKLTDEPEVMQHNRSLTLSGETANIVNLKLNGKTIYTDKNGRFSETLILENGYTTATLEAADRYGRITKITKPFVYTKDSG